MKKGMKNRGVVLRLLCEARKNLSRTVGKVRPEAQDYRQQCRIAAQKTIGFAFPFEKHGEKWRESKSGKSPSPGGRRPAGNISWGSKKELRLVSKHRGMPLFRWRWAIANKALSRRCRRCVMVTFVGLFKYRLFIKFSAAQPRGTRKALCL